MNECHLSAEEPMSDPKEDLHAAIMNLPCKAPDTMNGSQVYDYKRGHRDARHAAAELVLARDQELEALRKDAERWRHLRDEGYGADGKVLMLCFVDDDDRTLEVADYDAVMDAAINATREGEQG